MAFPDGHLPAAINIITDSHAKQIPVYDFASRNAGKEAELIRLGLLVRRIDLDVPEIQKDDPNMVLEAKARDAFLKYGKPILVEDSSLTFDILDGKPGPYIDAYTKSRIQREFLCTMLANTNRQGTFRVGLALSPDGVNVYTRIGEIRIQAALSLRGGGFGFDDMIEPLGQTGEMKTYGEMTAEKKDMFSPRAIAVKKLLEKPFLLPKRTVYSLPALPEYQLDIINTKEVTKSPDALFFARNISGLTPKQSVQDITISQEDLQPIVKESLANGEIIRYTTNQASGSQGLIIISHGDTKMTDGYKPKRLQATAPGEPFVFQMPPKTIQKAIATRATEYMLMHSDQMHQHILSLQHETTVRIKRPHIRSIVLEELLEMTVATDMKTNTHTVISPAKNTIATASIGYSRMYSPSVTSRKTAGDYGLFLKSGSIVSSIFSLGGMPMTTGSADTVATAALSYMRSWIPHNGFYAGSFEKQLALFTQAKEKIQAQHLPPEIENICIAQIGISIGSENPQKLAKDMKVFVAAGGKAIRIYTTNPNVKVIESAKAIRQSVGPEILLCVGPIVNIEQAKLLKQEADVQMFLVGHGGGETCTSLKGGGAANSISLLYELYLDTTFSDCIIGTEGGVGDGMGPLLGMVDVFSLNQSGVRGGVEISGGLFVKHVNGDYCLPNHGSASVFTQSIEALLYPDLMQKRMSIDGRIVNIEGKPNYSKKHEADTSIVDQFRWKRGVAGTALADLQSQSIYALRQMIANTGIYPLVKINPDAYYIAGTQRELW